jgi:hypothetical protein
MSSSFPIPPQFPGCISHWCGPTVISFSPNGLAVGAGAMLSRPFSLPLVFRGIVPWPRKHAIRGDDTGFGLIEATFSRNQKIDSTRKN